MDNKERNNHETGLEVAVIGMAGRFPGANHIAEFWNHLKTGVESISFFTDEELLDAGIEADLVNNPNYVKAKGVLEDMEYFDNSFFEYSPREAELMDPQFRILHECAWHTLEDAGYDPDSYTGGIGLYVGTLSNYQWVSGLLSRLTNQSEQMAIGSLNDRDFLSTRVAYKLNLKGPAVNVQTACSTSLVAIYLACQGLLSGESDMALAGGVSIWLPKKSGYLYEKGMVRSPDGRCRAFDAEAKGTNGGDAVAFVLLKRLEDARRDRDNIYAVVKGSAINNDGKRKVGYTAPSVLGQVEVIQAAFQVAEVEPESITYVETHGTGTTLGDPVEIEALKRVFGREKRQFCGIGSVKTNVGHLDAAAGVAGFIKTVLALKHRLIPPSLHFKTPNPRIDFENSPFYVNTTAKKWENNRYPLRAGVSSFGIGGTNAHVVLEEAPKTDHRPQTTDHRGQKTEEREYQLILLSAKTQSALDKMTVNLAEYFKRNLLNRGNHENPINPGPNLADAAYTLQVGRKVFEHRKMVVCSDVGSTIDALSSTYTGSEKQRTFYTKEEKKFIIFMFPGGGVQYVNMGLDLYKKEPVFREEMNRCFEILEPLMGYDIKDILYPSDVGNQEEGRDIERIDIANILIFIIEYSLARLLLKWGIEPDAMIGHSLGEYTAACLAGVFSLEEALGLVVLRGRLMRQVPGGAMLSVPLGKEELTTLLKNKELSLAASNSTANCVVSGPHDAIDSFANELKEKGINTRVLHISVASHSFMMDQVLGEFERTINTMHLKPDKPRIPFISNVTGNWITEEEIANPSYWSTHLRSTVRFSDGLEELLKEDGAVLVEVGAGYTLSTFARQYPQFPLGVNLIRHPQEDFSDDFYLLDKIGQLRLYGVKIDWAAVYSEKQRYRIPLPIYPFEKKLFTVDVDAFKPREEVKPIKDTLNRNLAVAEWFYTPIWEQSVLAAYPPLKSLERFHWLIFNDENGFGTELIARLKQITPNVTVVSRGREFSKVSDRVFTIDPRLSRHYDDLFCELKKLGEVPVKIVHLWGLIGEKGKEPLLRGLDHALDSGFYSLLNIVQAAGRQHISGEIQVEVVTDHMHNVIGEELICPEKATILGAIKIIPLEYRIISCRSIDILKPEPGSIQEMKLLDQLLIEFTLPGDSSGNMITFRGGRRWVQTYKPVPLEESRESGALLVEKGVYLITGGFGGMGFTLAEYLAKHYRARLILMGRSAFPEREGWDHWLTAHPEDDLISRRIRKIQEMEKKGAKVMIFSADVCNLRRMKTVLPEALGRFGSINGVLHTAGVADYNGVIQGRTREMTEHVMAPKVRGTLVLDRVLKDMNVKPDFIVLFSSLGNTAWGINFGQVGYTAANEFLDAYAIFKNTWDSTYTVSINWPAWEEVGMWVEASVHWAEKDENLDYSSILNNTLSPSQGITVFNRILASALCRVAVSPMDLTMFAEECHSLRTTVLEESAKEPEAGGQRHSRPELSTSYAAPRNEIEQTLTDIFNEFFGIDGVGIRDSFFELGGDSLKALILLHKIQKELDVEVPIADIFIKPTIEKLAEFILDITEKSTFSPIEIAEKKEYYALSSAQKRLFILHQMLPGNTAYNINTVLLLEGNVKREKLEAAFLGLIDRFESFRTSFELIEDQAVQRIHEVDEENFKIEYYQPLAPGRDSEKSAKNSIYDIIKKFVRPFDLAQPPLLRVGLMTLEVEKHILMTDIHHIISDGASMKIFTRELMAYYMGEELLKLNLQYKDFSQWQNSEKERESILQQGANWRKQFEGDIPILGLPFDYERPAVQTFEGNRLHFEMSKQETDTLKTYALEKGIRLHILLLSMYIIFISKLSNQEDIVVGTPVAGHRHADLEHIIGMFVNTLALRNFPGGEKNIMQFMDEVKERTLEAFVNQDYPYELLVDELAVERDASRNPLFDTMFSMQKFDTLEIEIPGLKLKPYDYDAMIGVSKFDLTLDVYETANGLLCFFEYSTKLFKKTTIERFIQYFKKVICSVLEEENLKISGIAIITGEEKQQLLNDFNNTNAEYPKDKTIYELFEEKVEKKPDNIAVIGRETDVQLTYREFDNISNLLVGVLREKGVTPETNNIVGIMVERSIEMTVGIFSILKAGGAYLPIDPGYPKERVEYMLAESNAKILMTTPGIMVKVEAKVKEELAGIVPIFNRPSLLNSTSPLTSTSNQVSHANVAYIIYTSGSTGKPKGVVIAHRSAINLLFSLQKEYPFRESDTYLLKTAYVFDVSFTELFGWFLGGGRLAILEKNGEKYPHQILEAIEREGITHINFVPSMFNAFLGILSLQDTSRLSSLKYIFLAGEALLTELVNDFINLNTNVVLENIYGPTEATVYSSKYSLSHWNGRGTIPIGKPLQNTRLYILDKYNHLQPIGIPGELCISGIGLAGGYLNRPELTAKKFMENTYLSPITNDQCPMTNNNTPKTNLLYKTGDLAKWLPDGNIEFLGRSDDQIKIRGFRIELGEIERQFLKKPVVKEVVVLARQDKAGDNYLCAYFVVNPLSVEAVEKIYINDQLREYISESLPNYMIPSYFIQIDKIPLTHNGKIDQNALPEPKHGIITKAYVSPEDNTQEILVAVWQEVLGVKKIGINDDFFKVGGDSIKAIQVSARLRKYGFDLKVNDLFLHPSIKAAARFVKEIERNIYQGMVEGEVPLTPIQQWFFESDFTDVHHFNQAVMVYRSVEEGFNEEILRKVFTKIVEYHDALRMVYEVSREGRERNKRYELGIVQGCRGIHGKLFDLEVFHLSHLEDKANIEKEIEKEANRIQGSIDLTRGPLVKLGLFKTSEGDHLLIVIHHLVVDGISWRILLEDFRLGYQQLEQGKEIRYQDKTDSFKYWSERLHEYASGSSYHGDGCNKDLLRELEYWKSVEQKAVEIEDLPKDHEIGLEKKKNKYTDHFTITLDEEETANLLQKANWAYNTQINDLLLTALAVAIKEWGGLKKVLINLEGHGRESIIENIDISRTVGWFTSQYPFLLDMRKSEDLSYAIKSVKEALRHIPKKGIGYGILRYLVPDEKKEGCFDVEPSISFNYLGEFGQEEQKSDSRLFEVSWINPGMGKSPELEKRIAIDINGILVEGQLRLDFTYNMYEYDRDRIGALGRSYKFHLLKIVNHCMRREKRELTPWDLGYNKITIGDLTRITHDINRTIDEHLEIQQIYSLSPMQSGMLYQSISNEKSRAYFEQSVFTIEGELEKSLLEASFNILIERYDIFRTIFFHKELKEPLQVVLGERKIQIYSEDITHMSEGEKEFYLEEFNRKDQERGFNLGKDILMRLSLFKIGLKAYRLVWSFHHILMDGWCLGVIFRELLQIYQSLKERNRVELEAVIPYVNYIRWLESQDKEEGLKYWESYLSGYEDSVGLPKPGFLGGDLRDGRDEEYKVEIHELSIDEKGAFALNSLARQEGVTINTLFQALWGILLQKYNNMDEVVYGVVVAGRPSEIRGIEQMVGLFINTVPLRIKSRAGRKFSQLLQTVQQEVVLTRPYEYLSLAEIQSKSVLNRSLLDHILVFENYPLHEEVNDKETGTAGREQREVFRVVDFKIHEQTNYDFNIIIIPAKDNRFVIRFLYNGLVYDGDWIEMVGVHIEEMIKQVINNPDIAINEIEVISEEEKEQVLYDFNQTSSDYPGDKTIHKLYEEQVAETLDNIAVIGMAHDSCFTRQGIGTMPHQRVPDKNLVHVTYRELNEKSNQLAYCLRAKGVQPDTIVGIMAERSIEMILGILAVLKAGGAYLPIDVESPFTRKTYMLNDSAVKLLLSNCHDQYQGELSRISSEKGVEVLNLENESMNNYNNGNSNNPGHMNHVSDLIYLIYTSGSTGRPKGVGVKHMSVVNLLWALQNEYPLEASDVYLLKTAYLFDVSVTELYGWFWGGGRLAVLERGGEKDPQKIIEAVERQGVTHINFVPSMFRVFVEQLIHQNIARLSSLKYIFLAGEALSGQAVDAFNRSGCTWIRLENLYGPTEATIYASKYSLDEWDGRGGVPIGKPLPNIRLYIVDKNKFLQPVGIPAELCISGIGLAAGYLNNPELTVEKFIRPSEQAGPFFRTLKDVRLYKTGDLARWLPDGNIEFLGRQDLQVKIRGYRIELGEIENQLLKHEDIKEVVVTTRSDGTDNTYLCAYIVCMRELGKKTDSRGIKEYLSRKLPGYMVPSYFIELEEIPHTTSGKVDRKTLPKPVAEVSEYIAPRNEAEEKLVELWSQVLGVEKEIIGINANFFELGGHSLKATLLISQISKALHVNLPLAVLFKTPYIRGLANYIKGVAKDRFASLEPAENKEYYALSSVQRRLYFLQQLDEQGIVYNLPSVFILEGQVDKKRLENTFMRLIERHESLRTSLHMIIEAPAIRIHKENYTFQITHFNHIAYDKKQIPKIIEDFVHPFDLSRAPLLRVGLINIDAGEHILMVDMHHIISDGTSMGVLVKEFMALYGGEDLPPLKIQYKDYSEWQNREESLSLIQQQEEYWLRDFEGEIPVLNLPTDFPRPVIQDFPGSTVGFEIDKEQVRALREYAFDEGATLYMVLLAIYNIFLSKLTGQQDIVVGTPIAGRRHSDLEGIIGMFVNTLALRNIPGGGASFKQFLEAVKERTLQAFANQDYPYEELVENVKVLRDTSRNPLFDSMFMLQNYYFPEVDIPGLSLKPYPFEKGVSRFDLTLQVIEEEENLICDFEYSTNLFREDTISRFISYFKELTAFVVENPAEKISEIELIPEKEKKQLLFDFNATNADYPKEKTIHELFKEQVNKTPGSIALDFEGQQLSYSGLNDRSSRLAWRLMKKGVRMDTIVGLMAARSLEMLIGIMGILKAGGTYLPIDPQYPEERLKYMLKESSTGILLTWQQPGKQPGQKPHLLHTREILYLNKKVSYEYDAAEDGIGDASFPTALAYVIYTSGSTGRPKGVAVKHKNAINFAAGITAKIEFLPGKSILALTTVSFDIFVLETLVPLLKGLKVVIATEDHQKDPQLLADKIEKEKVNMLQMTPSTLQLLFDGTVGLNCLQNVDVLMVGGERFPQDLFERLKVDYKGYIYNMYGPTETTVWSSVSDLTTAQKVDIGMPISNTQIYIIDRHDRLLPVGVAGELYIGGDGLARGYLNRPELTVEKFRRAVNDQCPMTNDRLYRTGDLARWLPGGNIECLGRIDSQVKLRGFRIELGEIESLLLTHDVIKEAVVIAKTDGIGDKYLCAYVVPNRNEDIEPGESGEFRQQAVLELKAFLSEKLPDYMIPSHFVPLGSIPLTPNGKIDRKTLPEPEIRAGKGGTYVAPRNRIEKKLSEIWSETLGIEKNIISIDANFFQMGGHSLKATTMVGKIYKELKVNLPLGEIFKTPTIRGLSGGIKGLTGDKYVSIKAVEEKEYYELSSAQKRLYILQQLDFDSTAYHMPTIVELEGDIDIGKMDSIFKKLITRHETLRTSFAAVDGRGVQEIQRQVEFEIEYLEIGYRHETIGSKLKNFTRPFDLSLAPLLRVAMIKVEVRKHILMADIHHIISDGISMDILVKEFLALYRGEELSELRLQYKDFSEWQNKLPESKDMKKQEAFWLEKFNGNIPNLDMPLDFKRPAVKSFEGDNIYFEIGRELTFNIEQLNRETGTTLFMFLLAVYNVLFHKYTGQTDIITGAPVSGRKHVDLQNLLGVFVNMIAFRNQPAPGKSFLVLLEEVKVNAIEAYENQDYQFEELVGKLGLQGETGRNPIFDVGLVMQDMDSGYRVDTIFDDAKKGDELKATPHDSGNRVSRFDMLLWAAAASDKIDLNLEYSTQLFKKSSMEIFCSHYKEILQQVAANKELKLEDITISSDLQVVKSDHVDLDFEFEMK